MTANTHKFKRGDVVNTTRWDATEGQPKNRFGGAAVVVHVHEGRVCQSGIMLTLQSTTRSHFTGELDSAWVKPLLL